MWVNSNQGARVKTATGRRELALNTLYEGYHLAEKAGNGEAVTKLTY